MMSCPLPFWGPTSSPFIVADTSTLAFVVALIAAAMTTLLVLYVAHGAMRTFLEARGVAPWSTRDTVFAIPLVLGGAALAAGSVAYLTVATVVPCPIGTTDMRMIRVLSLGLLAAALLMVWLGVRAIRKLT
jgi:hypothetical protein